MRDTLIIKRITHGGFTVESSSEGWSNTVKEGTLYACTTIQEALKFIELSLTPTQSEDK